MEIKIQLINDFVSYDPKLIKGEGIGNLKEDKAKVIFDKLVALLKSELETAQPKKKRSYND
jgi:hypothetical protein